MKHKIIRKLFLIAAMAGQLHSAVGGDLEDGIALAQKGDHKAAFEKFKPLAEAGDAKAQTQLAILYVNGRGIPYNDVEGFKWFLKAAEQGEKRAQINVGISYANGYGIEQDMSEAERWLQLATKENPASGYHKLGDLYTFPKKGVPSLEKALGWYLKAAQTGDKDAAFKAAAILDDGKGGVQKDWPTAAKLYTQSARGGNPQAATNLAFMYRDGRGVEKSTEQFQRWAKYAAHLTLGGKPLDDK